MVSRPSSRRVKLGNLVLCSVVSGGMFVGAPYASLFFASRGVNTSTHVARG